MPPQPTCETDSSSDEGIARSKSRSRSNVSAKRTSQSELDRNHHAARPMDLTSDSGYSSRTAATGSSADSAKSPNHRRRSPVKPQAPPAVPDAPAMAPAPAQTRPRQPESLKKKTATARESPKSSKTSTKHKDKRPVLVQKSSTQGRTASVSRRRDSLRQDCDDPNCRECLARPKPKLPPLVTGMNDEYSTYAPRSPRVPPSPGRPRFGYHHPSIETRIAGSTRPMYSRERPHSYYGGSALSELHDYPQSATSHGPPPSMYNHPQYANMMAPSPHAGYYGGPPPPSPGSASFDNRSLMLSRASDGYMPRPPAPGLPNPRYGPGLAAPSFQQAHPSDGSDDDDEDEHGYYLSSADRDRMIMPPPAQPAVEPSRRRPSFRSQTTGNIPLARAASVGYRDRPDAQEQGLATMTQSLQQLPPRRSSVAGSDRTQYSRNNVLIQPSRSDRPRDSERERTRRNTMYNRDFAHLELDPAPRREASADDRRREKIHNDVNKVEAYLAGMNGNYSTVVDGLRTNPARGRASSNAMPIRTTSHSQHSFDGASRISEGARSTSTRKTARDGNVAIRFEGSDMFVEGDMGDKILRVTTGEDGNQQITIADAKSRERKYHGEGSRVTTNTSSSRSRSDHDSARPRGDSRSAHDREIELKRRGMKQRSVRYADEPQREYFRTERSFRR